MEANLSIFVRCRSGMGSGRLNSAAEHEWNGRVTCCEQSSCAASVLLLPLAAPLPAAAARA